MIPYDSPQPTPYRYTFPLVLLWYPISQILGFSDGPKLAPGFYFYSTLWLISSLEECSYSPDFIFSSTLMVFIHF